MGWLHVLRGLIFLTMSDSSERSWLKPFLKPMKPVFREIVAMSLFINLLAMTTPIFTLQVYDRVIGSGGLSTLAGLVIGMFFVLIFDFILRFSRSRIMQRVALRVDVLVGKQLFDKLMAVPLDMLEAKPANHWQSLYRDVDTVRNTLSGASALLVVDLPFAFMFLGLIIIIAAPIAVVLLVILPLFMFVAWKSGNTMAAANQAERTTTPWTMTLRPSRSTLRRPRGARWHHSPAARFSAKPFFTSCEIRRE